MSTFFSLRLLAGASLAVIASPALAQQQDAPPPAQATPPVSAPDDATPAADRSAGGVGLNDIIVTGTVRPERKITTSISVSSVDSSAIQQINPQSAADLVRFIPGIRAEASGGEGNANIAVRGLPVASGGAKFVQFQEDGLPVLDFGDISFATADAFVKPDYNVERVELVRGGSASTATSNAPGAIINFISKTGKTDGGAIGVSHGIGFDRTRLDFDYGGHLSSDWRFHIGGFYQNGKGPKSLDYTAEDGGQIKANITHDFANGFIRLDAKYLDDRAPVWLPVPVAIGGTAGDASFSSLPGFNLKHGALQTKNLQNILSLDHNGNRITDTMSDGYRTLSKAFGAEASFDLGNGFHIDDHFRYAINSGSFTGPYPANVDTAQNIADSVGGTTTVGGVTQHSSIVYATGPNAGSAYTGRYAVNTIIFDTTLNNFNTYANQLTLSKDLDAGSAGNGTVTLGYFKSGQRLNMDWHWTDYLQGADGRNADLLDVFDPSGQQITDGGLLSYNPQAFGACCTQYYDVDYSIDAPWLDVQWRFGKLHLDGSVRYDIQSAHGSYTQNYTNGTAIDVNQDGVISVPEQNVRVVAAGDETPVDYTKHYWSYSVGANYEIADSAAVFARASRGARFNADRVLPADASGNVPGYAAVNFANQQEIGVKVRTGPFSGALTGFHTTTAEQGTDITPAGITIISRDYRAYGAEFEGNVAVGAFNLYGGLTYTDAKITKDAITPEDIGNVPQRQAKWVYQLRPTLSFPIGDIGATLVGTSSAPADNVGTLRQPGYTVIGLFADANLTSALQVQFHVDNLFDVVGITEVDQFPNAAGVGSARSILGRQVSAGVKFRF
ncbi:TonB-dependent receptor [Sphingomonas koreensis]|nr:TonB-dependent receptor [Sphingomonas koreensis]